MTTYTSAAVQFAYHALVPATPPVNETTQMLDKAFTADPLTREEKDKIAQLLYGTSGPGHSTYRLAGWAWDMNEATQIRRILVKYSHDNHFSIYFAPDKTSLRDALNKDHAIDEMIYA
jgi:hypothetical protein